MDERRMHIGPWTVTVTQDKIPIYSDSPTSDEDWTFIDTAGHGHFFAAGSADGYPTLIWVSVPCSMGHGTDCEGDGRWECRLCHETISPGTKPPSPYPTYHLGNEIGERRLRRWPGAEDLGGRDGERTRSAQH